MLDILKSRNQKEALYNVLIFAIFVVLMTVIMQFLWNGDRKSTRLNSSH